MQEVETQFQEVVFDLLHATAYRGGPLARTILGPAENVQSLTRDDIQGFINNFYRGPKMVLCGAGGIDHRTLEDLGRQYLGEHFVSSQVFLAVSIFKQMRYLPQLNFLMQKVLRASSFQWLLFFNKTNSRPTLPK